MIRVYLPKLPREIHTVIFRDCYVPTPEERLAAFRQLPNRPRHMDTNAREWPWQGKPTTLQSGHAALAAPALPEDPAPQPSLWPLGGSR
jgi:hypothetical protein